MGLLLSVLLLSTHLLGDTKIGIIAWILLVTSVSSFLAMNFTGSSTYTSLSGVKKEMRVAVPLQVSSVALAAILIVLDNII